MATRVAATLGLVVTAACGGPPTVGLGTGTTDPGTDPVATTSGATDGSTGAASTDVGSSSEETATGGPQICGEGGTPALEIGHGFVEFRPLRSGPAELTHGPQGGSHIMLGLRSPGIDVSQFAHVHLHGEIGGREVADHVQGAVLSCNDDLHVAEAIWVSLIFDPGIEGLHEQIVAMEITLTDSAGTTISAQAEVALVDPEFGASGSSDGSTGPSDGTSSADSGTTGT